MVSSQRLCVIMGNSVLIKNATVVTLDAENRIFTGDVLVIDDRIAAFNPSTGADEIIDASGRVLLPGFVQTHVHLCQTLFRGAADDLALIDWLKQRIWPLEAAHTPKSLRVSAQLGIAELIRGGTTCALTMETVNYTDEVFRVVAETGFRATVGKCLMDAGEDVPEALREATETALVEAVILLERWHGEANGRVRACFAPRFAVSCTRELLERVAHLARERQVLVHTHASENRDEIALVEQNTGMRNIAYLHSVGLTAPHVVLAHCIWLNEEEMSILQQTETKVAHCPSSNLKLGSGVAPITEMRERGISVSLGADGAPCNNRLDMFTEMRTAALLQKVRHGPQAIPALTALRMATIEGAKALGLAAEIGSIEIDKKADLILLNLQQLHCLPQPDLVATIVYSAQTSDVETVLIDGQIVMRDRTLLTLDEAAVRTQAQEQIRILR
jgi:5-methylthioadenosine/S-adenosylhomocysteine deaminase